MDSRDDLAALCKNAYYHARDHGGTMHTAADDAADAILNAGWVSPEDYREVFLRMGRAIAAIERVRAVLDDHERQRSTPYEADSHPGTSLIDPAQIRHALDGPGEGDR